MASDKTTTATPSTQQQKPRKPPLADWPTIKIVTPPHGRFSPRTDEWCITLSTQSIRGRVHNKEPSCRAICLRRVFAHEVKNVMAFNSHPNVGPDEKAKYALPAEGQPSNLPPLLGGTPPNEEDSDNGTKLVGPTKYWDEGWYLWTGATKKAATDKLTMMKYPVSAQSKFDAMLNGESKDLWDEHLAKMKLPSTSEERFKALQSARSPPEDSILVPLSPDVTLTPIVTSLEKLLAPTAKVLGILRTSVESGQQREFFGRVWAKAQTNEPFIVVQRTFNTTYDMWKKKRDAVEDDGKKGSP